MKLILYISNRRFKEFKINPPDYEERLPFDDNARLRQLYVDMMVMAITTKYIRSPIINYHIILVAESKMNKNFYHFDSDFMKKYLKAG